MSVGRSVLPLFFSDTQTDFNPPDDQETPRQKYTRGLIDFAQISNMSHYKCLRSTGHKVKVIGSKVMVTAVKRHKTANGSVNRLEPCYGRRN